MRPISTRQTNGTLGPPPGMEADVDPLPVQRFEREGLPVIVSTWELDEAELAEIARSRRLELHVWGQIHPPVALAVAAEIGEEDGTTAVQVEGVTA